MGIRSGFQSKTNLRLRDSGVIKCNKQNNYMTRVQQDLHLTVDSYDSLDSAGKKRNMFMRTAEKLEKSVKALGMYEERIHEANQKIESANKQCFAGNEELRALKEELKEAILQREIVRNLHADQVNTINKHRAELDSIKSKWYFKLFGR